jgi:hypothetical protein
VFSRSSLTRYKSTLFNPSSLVSNDIGYADPNGLSPHTLTWTDPGGSPNREFRLDAWVDLDGDANLDSNEESRTLFVTITKVEKIQYKLLNMTSYTDFSGPLKLVKGESASFRAVTSPPAASLPTGSILWGGSFGASGTGEVVVHSHDASYASSDSDTLTITAQCGNTVQESILVCRYVLGAHSNRSTNADGPYCTDGHAWVSITDFSVSPPTGDSYGLFAITEDYDGDGNPDTMQVNGAGYEHANSGPYNRYYALAPSEFSSFLTFVTTYHAYTYLYNCASWASDLVLAIIGEDVDADSSWFGIELPAEFGESIILLQVADPSNMGVPSASHR